MIKKNLFFLSFSFLVCMTLAIIFSCMPKAALADRRNDVKVIGYGVQNNGCPYIQFDLGSEAPYNDTYVHVNTTGATEVYNYLLVDGTPFISDWSSAKDVGQSFDKLIFYTPFPDGTTIELLEGMAFASGHWDGNSQKTPLSGDTLGNGFKMQKVDGAWVDTNAVGDAVFQSFGEVKQQSENFSVGLLFDRFITDKRTEITKGNILSAISVNNVSANELRENGALSVFADAHMYELIFDAGVFQPDRLQLTLQGTFNLPNGYRSEADCSKYYIEKEKVWVTHCSAEVKRELPVYFSDVTGNYQPERSGSLIHIPLRFEGRNSVSSDVMNFYSSDTAWLYSNPTTGRTEKNIDISIADGTRRSLLDSVTLDGKPASQLQIHYNLDSMDIWLNASDYDLNQAHTIEIKEGLTFPSGYYFDRTVHVYYTPEDGGYTDIQVQKIELDTDHTKIAVNETFQIPARTFPADAAVSRLRYEVVSGADVVSVNKLGFVTGLKEGSAVIRLTSLSDESIQETIAVDVEWISLESISLNKNSETLLIHVDLQLEVLFSPVNASEKRLAFESSDPSVATVDENGLVHTISAGSTVITITSFDETDGAKEVQVTVNVIKLVKNITVTPPSKTIYRLGEKFDSNGMVITAFFDDGSQEIIPYTAATVAGFSKNTPGEQVINVIYEGVYDSFVITVHDNGKGCGGIAAIQAELVMVSAVLAVITFLMIRKRKKNDSIQ